MNLLKQIRDRGLILDGAMSTALEKLGMIQIMNFGQQLH